MIDSTNEKPCLIKTEQGFSIQYKSKFPWKRFGKIMQYMSKYKLKDVNY